MNSRSVRHTCCVWGQRGGGGGGGGGGGDHMLMYGQSVCVWGTMVV